MSLAKGLSRNCHTSAAATIIATATRGLLAEFVGTALLVTVVVGSGIAAERLSPRDVCLQQLEKLDRDRSRTDRAHPMLGRVSGGHFNPVVQHPTGG